MSANDRQPGGDHYLRHGKGGHEQHWDRMWRLVGPGWFIANATKYAERCYDKNGLDDIDKAVHYLEKLKELTTAWLDGTGPPPGQVNLEKLRPRPAEAPPAALPPGWLVTASTQPPAPAPRSKCAHGNVNQTCPFCVPPVNKEQA